MLWDGRNNPKAFKLFGQPAYFNYCSVIWGDQEVELWPYGGTLQFRDLLISPRCTIFYRDICQCLGHAQIRTLGWIIVKNMPRETDLWHEMPAYITSLLKAYYGSRATEANDFGYGWLPKLTEDHSHIPATVKMLNGEIDGFFVMGQNPAVGSQNARLQRKALAKLKWLVVRDMVEIETASFWYQSPEIERGELKTEEIETEVFLFPVAAYAEKEGTFTNTQRLLQWREKAVNPPGDCRSELWFIHHLAKRLRAKAMGSSDLMNEALLALDWWYPEDEHASQMRNQCLAEINGFQIVSNSEDAGKQKSHHGRHLDSYSELKSDGSTASGCWIYSGVFGSDGINKANGRKATGTYGHGWGFAWPADRRILYNRASARPDGQPWSDRKRLVWWDEESRRWVGNDVADFPIDKAPNYQPPPNAEGVDAQGWRSTIYFTSRWSWLALCA